MAGKCDLCGKKIGFGDIESYIKTDKKRYTVCRDCFSLYNLLKEADEKWDDNAVEQYRATLRTRGAKCGDVDYIIESAHEKAKEARKQNEEKVKAERASVKERAEMEAESVRQREARLERMRKDRENRNSYMLENRAQAKESLDAFRVQQGQSIVYCVDGARGRRIEVYPNKCMIHVDATLGAIVTGNSTDGDKYIYYQDVLGLQFKKPGVLIGYIQLETASGLGNNIKDNFFNENTFTFDVLTPEIEEMYEYIQWRMDETKKKLLGM